MKKLKLVLLLAICSVSAWAQNFSVQGKVYDTLSSRPIPFASVSLLNTDSILLQTKRTVQDGSFTFQIKDTADYVIIVSHPKFLIHSRLIKISSATPSLHLEKVTLFNKKQVLKTVIIQDKKAVVIKGDTITFAADSFQTKAGDVVEDLLKLLPGIQVDDAGNITSQGKKVEKVLVNGEEFFGDDPTIATQNLPSKAIDKVEVYDSKDAQEQFTGFTTDKDTKVVNLKLKKDMNRGLMGKVGSAAGWNDRWEQEVMLNRFQDKEQISAYYLSGSNGNAYMGWQDGNTYGRVASGANSGSGGNSFRGAAPYGITKSWKVGGRYANRYDKRKQEVNVSYGHSRTAQERNKRSYSENLLPGNTFYKSDTNSSTTFASAHALNFNYKTDIDSLLRLEYKMQFTLRSDIGSQNNKSINRNDLESPLSTSNTKYTSEGLQSNVRNKLNLNKKFNKKGRTLSNQFSYNFKGNKSTGYLNSNNSIDLLNGGLNILLDQKKKRDNKNYNLENKIVYTEPLSKNIKTKVSYRFSDVRNNNSNITTDTFGYTNGSYSNQLDSLSTIFNSRQLTHSPGAVIRFEEKKWRISLENEFAFVQFIQKDELRENNFDYEQFNYLPKATIQYKINKYKNLRLSYNGRTQMPNANQLQPFQNNAAPLNVIIGNPNLRMSYNQNISLYFSSYAPIEGHSTYINFYAGNRINPIGTNRTFEPSGRTITSYLNLPTSNYANMWGHISRKIQSTHYKYSIGLNGNYSYNPNVINNIAGANKNLRLSMSPSLSYYNKELFSFRTSARLKYNRTQNSGNASRTVEYWNHRYSANLDLFLPRFITISSYLSYEYTPIVAPYTSPFQRTYWRPSISKQFLKKRNLIVKFEALDALNQNQGYSRQNNINYNTESFYNTLGRYWLLGATWNFFTGPSKSRKGKFGKKGDKSGQGWLGKKRKTKESATPASDDSNIIIIED